jgi:hypothetical protein
MIPFREVPQETRCAGGEPLSLRLATGATEFAMKANSVTVDQSA